MSTLSQHRAAIVAALASVPAMGIVHERERHAGSNGAFADLYLYTPPAGSTPAAPHIRGWWLRRSSTAEHSPNLHRHVNVHTWEVRGYLAFRDADATELVLDDLVEQFRAVVRADPTLGGVCQPGPLALDDATDGVQVLDAGPVVFAGVLCHSVVLQLKTWSYL
ncbi:hypothetical protein [Ottowia sp.]|uniref:hypothetical protein n=1 Tax=Ottowia sp. TaxID=1898956 RepID=UPI0025D7B049|nr:hypothetical protein [Ottowia sp.]